MIQLEVLVIQRFEMNRAQERLLRLDQQDRLGVAVVVVAAPEMHARLDRDHVEVGGIDADLQKRLGIGVLVQVRTDDDHVTVAELDADPELGRCRAGATTPPPHATAHGVDSADHPHRIARRNVELAADFHVEGVARLDALLAQGFDGVLIRDGADQHAAQLLLDDLLEQPGGGTGAVAVIRQHHRHLAFLDRLLGETDTLGHLVHLGAVDQLLA